MVAGRSMPGPLTAAVYTSLMVALYVAEPAIVSLTGHVPTLTVLR